MQYVTAHAAILLWYTPKTWPTGPDYPLNSPPVRCRSACRRPAAPLSQTAADCFHKGNAMHRFALALLLSTALAFPALAQKKEEAKKDAAKVAIPTNTFFKGQTASQYLAREQLIGAKVLNKDGQAIGTIDDLIIGSGDKIEGVVMGVG